MTQPQVAIAITADDKTAKGWASAEKRAGKSLGKIGGGKDALKATQDGIGRSSKGIVKSLSAIEHAGSRVLSGGGIIGKAGAVRDIGLLARGFGAAAAEGIGLEGAAIGVTGAVAGIAGAAVVAGAAMWKLADGWGKSANQLGNMASLIGISTAGLQKFAGAAERVGVDKDTATGTLGTLSQTLNDARYGRNNGALAILGKMGVKLQTNQDGTVNVEAMLPAIATALASQNSSGRRTAGHALGISDAAMAAFTQGGANLSADMDDYGKNGGMISAADTKLGRALTHRDTVASQWVGKEWMAVQRANAGIVKGVGDGVISAANGASKISPPSLIGSASAQEMPDAGPFSKSMDMASEADMRRADRVWKSHQAAAAGVTVPGLTPEAIAAAQGAERKWGLPASVSLAQYKIESSLGRHMPKGSNNPFGKKEFDPSKPRVWASTREFEHGRMVRKSQPFHQYGSIDEAFDDHARLLMQGRAYAAARRELPDVGKFVRDVAPVYATDPNYRGKFQSAEQEYRHFDAIPVKVDVHLHGGGRGDRVTVSAGRGSRPAISHAMP